MFGIFHWPHFTGFSYFHIFIFLALSHEYFVFRHDILTYSAWFYRPRHIQALYLSLYLNKIGFWLECMVLPVSSVSDVFMICLLQCNNPQEYQTHIGRKVLKHGLSVCFLFSITFWFVFGLWSGYLVLVLLVLACQFNVWHLPLTAFYKLFLFSQISHLCLDMKDFVLAILIDFVLSMWHT